MAEQIVAPGLRFYVPADTGADVHRSLCTMRRWEKINDGHHSEKRVTQRTGFFAKVVLAVTTPSSLDLVLFPVWGRNLSASGVAAVCTPFLEPLYADRKLPRLELPTIHERATSWQCGLYLSPTEFRWMDCRIVRLRDLPTGMFDLGVQFLRRNDSFLTDLAPQFHGVLQSWME